MSRSFHYSARALAGDYACGATGLACAATPLLFVQPAAPLALALAATAALFLVYFGRTVYRQLTHIELDEAGIRVKGPLGAAIRWEDLRSLRLNFYSTRRDREGGWMQLRLRDARCTIRVDSELDGFAGLVRAAAAEAARLGVEIDDATRGNLAMLGNEA